MEMENKHNNRYRCSMSFSLWDCKLKEQQGTAIVRKKDKPNASEQAPEALCANTKW